jgi:hypothetical protein
MALAAPPRRAPLRRVVGLTLGSKLAARLAFAAFLVFGTYNPTGTSILHWLATGAASPVWKIVAGGVLAVAWAIVLPVTLRALGLGGIVLTTAATGAALFVLVEAGLLDLAAPRITTWILLTFAATLLGVGLAWMTIAIALDGQVRLRDLTR